ncbi:unnamed protein product [Amoebophrya sp. A120]|nr:unnamed protein product [Amoebophrya sp. A120]|eukprot:GSA120T00018059001.1
MLTSPGRRAFLLAFRLGGLANLSTTPIHVLVRAAVAPVVEGKKENTFYPFWEPSVQEWFKPLEKFKGASRRNEDYYGAFQVSVPTFAEDEITPDVAARLAIRGQPFVVKQNLSPWPFQNWTCTDFAKAFPDGDMRDEYDHRTRAQVKNLIDDSLSKRFKEVASSQHLAAEQLANGEKTKINAPFVWHVKDEAPVAVKRELGQHFRRFPATFLKPGSATKLLPPEKVVNGSLFDAEAMELVAEENLFETMDSFEYWFSPPGGTAVYAHADSYCETTISWQLRGRKQWRAMMYPEGDGLEHRFESFDEGPYAVPNLPPDLSKKKKNTEKRGEKIFDPTTGIEVPQHHMWRPEFDFTLEPGEMFVFSPNYMHETFVAPDTTHENHATDCAIASTFQWLLPYPTKYYRAFLPRHTNSALHYEEQGSCMPYRLFPFVFFGYREFYDRRQFPKLSTSTWMDQTRQLWKKLTKKDPSVDHISKSALLANLLERAPADPRGRSKSTLPQQSSDRFSHKARARNKERTYGDYKRQWLKVQVEELFGYHDTNDDDRITQRELFESLAQMHVIAHRQFTIERFIRKNEEQLDREREANYAKGMKYPVWLVKKWQKKDAKNYSSLRSNGLQVPKEFRGDAATASQDEKKTRDEL